MTSALENMLARSGKSLEDFQRHSHMGRIFRRRGVRPSPELQRILWLPRRRWQEEEDLGELRRDMTDWLKTKDGSMELWPVQAAALRDLHDFGGLFAPVRVGGGKCVAGETEIYDVATGCRRRVDALGSLRVATMEKGGKIGVGQAYAAPSGEKQCIKLELADGAAVTLSEDHAVFTQRGWISAGDLLESDLVATPRQMPSPDWELQISDDEVKMAAYLLSDGSTANASTGFTNQNSKIIKEVLGLAEQLSNPARDLHGAWKERGWRENKSKSNAREFSFRGLSWFRRKWGITGRAKEKRIPAAFWGMSKRQIGLFLNRFWACDGWVEDSRLGIVLASEGLIDDLRFLLLRCGVRARKKFKTSRCEGKQFPSWRLNIRSDQIIPFANTVGVIFSKEYRCSKLYASRLHIRTNTNVDVVPIGCPECIEIGDEMGWPGRGGCWRKRAADPLKGMRTLFRKHLKVSSGQRVSRSGFAAACRAFGYNGKYAWLANSDLTWERVQQITAVGIRPVFDLSVPQTHNFVGGGIILHNTLVSYLAPTVLWSERPLLLIPAKLKRKTEREFVELAKHWRRPIRYEIMSYELLSRDRGSEELERAAPDLIVGDEIHRLRHEKAGCTRKIRRWMREHPETKFAAMSGTITTRSLLEYVHILRWCLPDHPPLPYSWRELQDWADALDEKVQPQNRLAPGALLDLCTGEEKAEAERGTAEATDAARNGYRRRLTETPGVIATDEDHLGVSLSVTGLDIRLGAATAAAFDKLRRDWETPDGWPIMEAMELWRHARELAVGFFYKWDPRPPKEWLRVRKEWAAFVRDILSKNFRNVDTEYQVARACVEGRVGRAEYDAWVGIRPTFEPNTVPVWIDDTALDAATRWLDANEGLCWTEHRAFALRLEGRSGYSYFGSEGRSRDGTEIEEGSGPVIASIASNSEGRNLQHTWFKNLIVSCPSNGRIFEQLLGRTHREGQEADEVSFEVFFACREQWKGFQQALADARYIQSTTGQPQKLLYGDVDVLSPDEVAARIASGDPMWRE